MSIPSNQTAFPAKFSFGLVTFTSKTTFDPMPSKPSSIDAAALSLLAEKRNLAAQGGWLLFEFFSSQVKNEVDSCFNVIRTSLPIEGLGHAALAFQMFELLATNPRCCWRLHEGFCNHRVNLPRLPEIHHYPVVRVPGQEQARFAGLNENQEGRPGCRLDRPSAWLQSLQITVDGNRGGKT